jgi:pimeloyl-ACP methyl ester carboxylesterase
MWKQIYPRLVEAGYRVVMHDRRGYGQSEPGPDFNEFYVSDRFRDESVEDFAALCDMLGVDSFSIVGQCEGGVVGVDFATRFPDRVNALVIASTLCHSTTTMTEFNSLKFPNSFHELAQDIRDKMVLWHGADHAEPLYEMARIEGGEYGVGKFDLRPRLPFVACPTLVLYPDRSALFEVEQAVTFYRILPNAELAVIPRCGHNTYDQKPEEYLGHVLKFLNRVTDETRPAELDFSMTCLAPAPPRR